MTAFKINKRILALLALLMILLIIPGAFLKEDYMTVFPLLLGAYMVTAYFIGRGAIKEDILRPDLIFMFLFSGYALIWPICAYLIGYFGETYLPRYVSIIKDYHLITYGLYLCVISLVSFGIGYAAVKPASLSVKAREPVIRSSDRRNIFFIFSVYAFLGFFFLMFLYSIYKFGFSTYFFGSYSVEGMNDPYLKMSVFSVEYVFSLLLVWALFLINSRSTIDNAVVRWSFAASIIFLLMMTFLHGSRMFALTFLLSLAMIHHYKVRKLNIKKVIIWALLLMVIFSFIIDYRSSRQLNGFEAAGKAFNPVFVESTLSFYTLITVLQIYDQYQLTPHLYGLGFLDSLINLLPRPFFPDKENMFIQRQWDLENRSYHFASPAGGSFVVGELFVNGGKTCIILFFIFLGWFSASLYKYYLVKGDLIAQIIFFIGIPLMMVHAIRDPIAITFKLFIQNVVLIAFAAYLLIPREKAKGKG